MLLFTGARLREILHLMGLRRFRAGHAVPPGQQDGEENIYLNGPALAVLQTLPRLSPFVSPGEGGEAKDENAERPRHDLKRPWEGIRRMAGLEGVRLHDLRHTHASFGVGGGLGLPIIAKLLGHTQIRTTERYSISTPIRSGSPPKA